MRKCTLVLVALLCVGALFLQGCTLFSEIGAELGIDMSADAVYNKCAQSVVEITAKSTAYKKTGTGFFYDNEGTVITNYHVIEGCTDVQIQLLNGKIYIVDCVLGYDAKRDIAVLATKCTNSVPLEFGKDAVYTGQKIYTIGSSLGLTSTFSDGMVSCAKRLLNDKTYIQISAPISPGNSGGPLLDAKGRVIGINSASMLEGQNLNFAIPIDDFHNVSLEKKEDLTELFTRYSSGVGSAKRLRSWAFTWTEENAGYDLTFELCDERGNNVTVPGSVVIEIVNDSGETVYKSTASFGSSDYITIETSVGEKKLVSIHIPDADIAYGRNPQGTVSFRVSGVGYSFDEATVRVVNLPSNY